MPASIACKKCKKRNSCNIICDELDEAIDEMWPSNKLDPIQVYRYALIVLSVSGLTTRKILYAARKIAKIQKSRLHENLTEAMDHKQDLVGYFLDRNKRMPIQVSWDHFDCIADESQELKDDDEAV